MESYSTIYWMKRQVAGCERPDGMERKIDAGGNREVKSYGWQPDDSGIWQKHWGYRVAAECYSWPEWFKGIGSGGTERI